MNHSLDFLLSLIEEADLDLNYIDADDLLRLLKNSEQCFISETSLTDALLGEKKETVKELSNIIRGYLNISSYPLWIEIVCDSLSQSHKYNKLFRIVFQDLIKKYRMKTRVKYTETLDKSNRKENDGNDSSSYMYDKHYYNIWLHDIFDRIIKQLSKKTPQILISDSSFFSFLRTLFNDNSSLFKTLGRDLDQETITEKSTLADKVINGLIYDSNLSDYDNMKHLSVKNRILELIKRASFTLQYAPITIVIGEKQSIIDDNYDDASLNEIIPDIEEISKKVIYLDCDAPIDIVIIELFKKIREVLMMQKGEHSVPVPNPLIQEKHSTFLSVSDDGIITGLVDKANNKGKISKGMVPVTELQSSGSQTRETIRRVGELIEEIVSKCKTLKAYHNLQERIDKRKSQYGVFKKD